MQLLSNQRPWVWTLLFWKNFLSLSFSSEHLDASTGRIPDVGINQYMHSIFWPQGRAYDPVQINERSLWRTYQERQSWVVWCVSEAAGSREGVYNVSLSMEPSWEEQSQDFWVWVTSSEPESNCVWSQICSKTFQDVHFSSLSQFRLAFLHPEYS